jgi:hypothetical protein
MIIVLITRHARDHKLHVWTRVEDLPASARVGGSAALPNLLTPVLCYSLDVNALNYCRFSLFPTCSPDEALIALPNLVESSEVRRPNPCRDKIWTVSRRQTSGLFLRSNGFTRPLARSARSRCSRSAGARG